MGWTVEYTERPRADFIRDRLKGWDNEIAKAVLLDHADHGSRLWKVCEITWKQGENAGKTMRFIALDLISKRRGEGWGYKDLEESSGPSELDCPLRFFKLVRTPDGQYGREWREEVRRYWAEKKTKMAKTKALQIGQQIDLAPGFTPSQVTIVSLKPLRGQVTNGRIYNLTPRCIAA